VEHAKTCVLGTKLFIYYTDETNSTGIMFNNIYELRGLIAEGQFYSLESLTPNQKVNFLSIFNNKVSQFINHPLNVINNLFKHH
jgi:hypothetical protein